MISKNKITDKIGFATTGVLIDESENDKEKIILVHNRNLRDGHGLWVPPGGHYLPHAESPVQKLKTKIEHEIGVDCKILNPYKYNMALEKEDIKMDKVEWIIPPVFLLEEDLMGKCSQGHLTHIDSIYICTTNGGTINKNHKYDTM